MLTKIFTLATFLFFNVFCIFGQITITTGIPASTLVQDVLVGQGVSVSNVTFTGNANSIGKFQTGAVPTNLGIAQGIVLSTGIVNDSWAPIGSAASNSASTDNYYSGNSLLTTLAGYTTFDAAILEFDFVPLSDTIKFKYVFGSEEYHEYVNGGYNDVFAFFITGPNPLGGSYSNYNIARIPGTTTPVSIDNVNNGNSYNDCASGPCTNCAYFVDNCYGTSVVYDAFTVVLTAWAKVTPCQSYHLKIAIADAGDGVLDSGVFLEAGSFNTNAVQLTTTVSAPAAGSDAIEGCNNVTIKFELPAPSPINRVVPFTVAGTATNGVDYQAIPNSVTIPAGSSLTTLEIIPFIDGLPEGTETVTMNVQTSPCTNETITINILDYTMITATGTGSTTICGGGGPVQIGVTVSNGIAPYTYAWDNGLPSTQTHSVSPISNTTYTVTVSDACGNNATASVTINISASLTITIDPPQPEICANTSQTLTAGGALNYLWNTSSQTSSIIVTPQSTTSYQVTGSDANGCTGSAQVTVTVYPNLTVSIAPIDPKVCEGSGIVLTASSNGTNPSFQWDSGQTGSSISVTPPTETQYSVNVSDDQGCTGSASVTVEVFSIPYVDFSANPLSGCTPLQVTFENLSETGLTFLWNFGNGGVSAQTNPIYQYNSAGTFTVTLIGTNAGGCKDTMVRPSYIQAIPSPIAGFHPSATIAYEDEPWITFTDYSLGALNWNWNFGDGNPPGTSTEQNPDYTFPGVGVYDVWLWVENSYGCTDSTHQTITIRPLVTFYIPNAFSPNNDGINDVFIPYGNSIDPDNYSMMIFDRWGKEIFQTKNLNTFWDGTISSGSGKPVPPGSYVYVIQARFNGIDKIFEGTVTVVY